MERDVSVMTKPENEAKQTGKISQSTIAALLFFLVISAFFYLIIVGIKSDYHPSMTLEEIANADLAVTTVPIGRVWLTGIRTSFTHQRTLPG